MAEVKISELPALGEAPAAADVVPLVDTSAGITKKNTISNFFSYLTGAISGVLTSNLTVSRLLVSDSSGKISVASVTSTEAGYLTGQTDYTNTRPVVNLLYNGNWDLWDLGTSFAGAADDSYVLPGWNSLSSTTSTISQQTSSPPEGCRYYLRMAGGSPNIGTAIVFFFEAQEAIPLRNKTVSLSMYVKGDTTGTLKTAILTWGSTADSITSDVVSSWAATPTWAANWTQEGDTSHSITTSWTRFTHEAISLDTASFNNIALVIYSYNQGVNFDISQVQLEVGSKASGFVSRPVAQEEILANRRRLRLAGDASGNGPAFWQRAGAASEALRFWIPFPVKMRTAPTGTVAGTWALVNATGPTLGNISSQGASMIITSAASGLASAQSNGTDDYLDFNAEL